MSIPWMRLALVVAVCVSTASAMAAPTNFDPTNHTTRNIGLLVEDSGCTNTTSPGAPPSAAPASCFVHASDIGPPAATYTDPTNDYYGVVSFVGLSLATKGTNTFQVTVSAANWAKILAPTLASWGTTFVGTSSFSFAFDATSGVTAAGNYCTDPPGGYVGTYNCFYQATAVFAGNGFILTGFPDHQTAYLFPGPADYPYFGNSSTFGGSQFSGPPLVFSCAWSAGLLPSVPIQPLSALGPAGYLTTPIPIPSPPCGTPIAQQGFELGGLLPNTSIDFLQITTSELSASPGMAYADAVYTDYKFWLTELTDTDGDGVPDYPNVTGSQPLGTPVKNIFFDNCPFTPNGPSLGTCMGPPGSFGITCHVNADCGAGGTCDVSQTDRGGVGTSTPDGIGDACQCGDVDNNGIVNNNDATFVRHAVAGIAPYPGGVTTLPGYNKCQVVNGAPGLTCNNAQATIIQRAVAGLSPGIKQGCHAATIFP